MRAQPRWDDGVPRCTMTECGLWRSSKACSRYSGVVCEPAVRSAIERLEVVEHDLHCMSEENDTLWARLEDAGLAPEREE